SAGVDYLGLSFARSAADVERLRQAVGSAAGIVAKIERPDALTRIDEIVHAEDAVMVARGDLGFEMPLEQLPSAQLRILRAATNAAKPVITATQMLESMIENPR